MSRKRSENNKTLRQNTTSFNFSHPPISSVLGKVKVCHQGWSRIICLLISYSRSSRSGGNNRTTVDVRMLLPKTDCNIYLYFCIKVSLQKMCAKLSIHPQLINPDCSEITRECQILPQSTGLGIRFQEHVFFNPDRMCMHACMQIVCMHVCAHPSVNACMHCHNACIESIVVGLC